MGPCAGIEHANFFGGLGTIRLVKALQPPLSRRKRKKAKRQKGRGLDKRIREGVSSIPPTKDQTLPSTWRTAGGRAFSFLDKFSRAQVSPYDRNDQEIDSRNGAWGLSTQRTGGRFSFTPRR